MKKIIKKTAQKMGFDIVRHQAPAVLTAAASHEKKLSFPPGTSAADQDVVQKVTGFTMTSIERQLALIEAVRYVVRRNIPGCFVECGVWRGGSSMIIAMVLAQEGVTDRDLHLFDTFEGMSPPTDADKSLDGTSAQAQLAAEVKGEQSMIWCCASIEDVRANMERTGYPMGRVHLIKGTVEQTIPAHSPASPIALLRLDTDWYESTKHEMEHLFPMLEQNGVLIIDDYGHWQGARKAIDEYLQAEKKHYLMHPIDYTGRILVKN